MGLFSVIKCSTSGLLQMAQTPVFFNHALLRNTDAENDNAKPRQTSYSCVSNV